MEVIHQDMGKDESCALGVHVLKMQQEGEHWP